MESKFTQENGLQMLRQLPNNSVDLILTDPPYIISRDSGMHRLKESGKPDKVYGTKYAITTDYGDWDALFTTEVLEEFLDEFKRVLRNGGSVIIFFDLWKIETLKNLLDKRKFTKVRLIEWLKTNPVPINSNATYLSNAREIALSCVKGGKATFNSKYHNGQYSYPIYQGTRAIDRIHPTQKSLPLFTELIQIHSNPGDLIVDPFGGSGTTFIAARQEMRECISCEIDPLFFEKTVTRLKHYNLY